MSVERAGAALIAPYVRSKYYRHVRFTDTHVWYKRRASRAVSTARARPLLSAIASKAGQGICAINLFARRAVILWEERARVRMHVNAIKVIEEPRATYVRNSPLLKP